MKLILGFYSPSSGSVLLDGKDLGSLDLRSVRRQIGAVLQGSELLPSSILFNIVGTTKKTLEDAWTAARRACIAEDIEQMPMKLWTALSDRAVTISGGQKQRILIARALVREPKLVIFDEATSALDNKTQAGVMAALREMDCTKICIAHRLSTVVHADRIVVMNKGAIVQQGTYDTLMSEEGLFRTLALSQLEQPDDAHVGIAGTATWRSASVDRSVTCTRALPSLGGEVSAARLESVAGSRGRGSPSPVSPATRRSSRSPSPRLVCVSNGAASRADGAPGGFAFVAT